MRLLQFVTLGCIFILLISESFAQTASSSTNTFTSIVQNDSSLYDLYSKLIDKEFTKVLTDQSTNFGTFGSISTEDDITTINGHFKLAKKSSLGVNVKGGNSGGILSILQGETISSNFSASLQFNFGIYSLADTVYADATEVLSFIKTYDSLIIHTKKQVELIDLADHKLSNEILKKQVEIQQKQKKLDMVKDFNSVKDLDKRDSLRLLSNTLKYEIKKLNIEVDFAKKEEQTITTDWKSQQSQIAYQKMVSKYKSSFKKLSLTGYNLKWFSLSAGLDNRSFKRFLPTNPVDNRIINRTTNQYEFGVAFNQYKLDPEKRRSFFSSLSANLTIKDNFDELQKRTIKTIEELSTVPNQQIIESNTTVYQGDYKTNIWGFKLDYNRYQFLNLNRTLAFRVNPSLTSSFEDVDISLNGTVGFLIGFKNKEDKTIINSELFYSVDNIISEEEDADFIDRSAVGLRLNFPIIFSQKL